MLIEQYFAETKPALLHIFSALDEYDRETPPPSLSDYADETGVIKLDRSQAKKYLSDVRGSLALDVAKATLCGALLQVGFTAINLFPRSDADPTELSRFKIKPRAKASRFCVGRKVCGIPVGLLVYAGRIQFNHWDERKLDNPVALRVLEALREFYRTDVTFDLAYAWEWPGPRPISHHIVRHELEWMAYEDFTSDVGALLHQPTQPAAQALRDLGLADR